jgi:hypothetical protein
MTADDFFLLFIAFGGFVVAPALLLWSFVRIADRKQDGKRGPDVRPDVGSPGASNGDGRKEAARSGRASDSLRRLAGWTDAARRRVEHRRCC